MEQEILDLLNRIGGENPPTDEELRGARDELVRALRATASPENREEIDLEAARAIREAIDNVDAEVTRRREEEEQMREEAQQLLEGIDDGAEEGEEGEEGEEREEEASADDPPADDPPAENLPATEQVAEPVAASTAFNRGIERAANRRQRTAQPIDVVERPSAVEVLTVGPALAAEAPSDLSSAASTFHRYAHQVTRGRQALLTLKKEFPEDRALTASAATNTDRLNTLLQPRALVASGGVCEPLPADFEHPICGDRGRPIRDALPQFGADRGGVRYAPSATLGDLSEAVGVWTHATDQTPEANTKPCPHVECEAEVEVYVDAVTACLTVGNFQARFNPEFWESKLDLLMIQHDRAAEQHLFSIMQAAATAVTVDNNGNTAQSLFLALDRAAAALRSRHRLTGTTLRYFAPTWLRDALRASIARQGPGDGVQSLAVANTVISDFFTNRNIDPVWSPDIDPFGAQTAGPLLDWPGDEATTLLAPEGTFFHMDGGTLDLGTEIRDSQLNETNDRQAFMETFEHVAFRGCEALQVTVPVGEDCVCNVVQEAEAT